MEKKYFYGSEFIEVKEPDARTLEAMITWDIDGENLSLSAAAKNFAGFSFKFKFVNTQQVSFHNYDFSFSSPCHHQIRFRNIIGNFLIIFTKFFVWTES